MAQIQLKLSLQGIAQHKQQITYSYVIIYRNWDGVPQGSTVEPLLFLIFAINFLTNKYSV